MIEDIMSVVEDELYVVMILFCLFTSPSSLFFTMWFTFFRLMSSELTVSYAQPWSSDIAAGTDNTTDYLDNLEHFDDLSSQVKCRLLFGLVRRGVGEGEEERDRVNTLIDRAKRDDNHVRMLFV
jgi:hypothetical protein